VSSRLIRTAVAMIVVFIASRFPDSTLANVVEYSALGYLTLDIVLMARAGYLRRRPYWTAESWRRYLAACAIRVGALLAFLGMAAAIDFKLAVVGAPGSPLRAVWIGAALVFFLVGVWGLTSAISWLTEGDPAQPFTRSPLRRRPASSAGSAG